MFKKAVSIAIAILVTLSTYAQNAVPQGWHLKDFAKNGVYGISLDQAKEFVKSKNLKSEPVIVGIVDSGIDTTHEDLKDNLWVNKGEIPGNGIDDDKNGYVDDVHGWNFIGSKDGKENVTKDSYEAARVYWALKSKYENKTAGQIPATDKTQYADWQRAKADVMKGDDDNAQKDDNSSQELANITKMQSLLKAGDSIIRNDLKKETYNCTDLQNYKPTSLGATQLREIMMNVCRGNDNQEINNKMLLGELDQEINKINNKTKPPVPYRDNVVKDNYSDFNDKYYGNNNLLVDNESALHGTHVGGIIGAIKNNNVGMEGVADNVLLMSVRAVPDGDEHDKDIALAIRYAVDNGARIINMSFGKGFSPEKKWVDDAVKYAVSKNVLLVHAAGNDAKNNDSTFNYPSAYYLDRTRPATWITVGASGPDDKSGIVANFSNYGKKEVDVFAPGVKIYATIPGGNTYGNLQGTSMASPVVAGLAAFILNYYPSLSAVQVKDIIEKSVVKPTEKITNPASGEKVPLSDISVTGGIVNAYKAIKLASETKPNGSIKNVAAPAKSASAASKKTSTKKKK